MEQKEKRRCEKHLCDKKTGRNDMHVTAAGTAYYLTGDNSLIINKYFPYWKISGTTLVPPSLKG